MIPELARALQATGGDFVLNTQPLKRVFALYQALNIEQPAESAVARISL